MKIYTRTGDKGTTSLVGGTRVAKDHPRLEAYGTVDELMAHTAYLRDNMENHPQLTRYRDELLQVLDHLMRLSSYLATEEEAKKFLPAFDGTQVALLEQWIDGIQSTLPTIDKFTLPGGHPIAALCHIARTVCRRSERRAISLSEQYPVNEFVLRYLNRLSDYFYVLARKISMEFNIKEILWVYDK